MIVWALVHMCLGNAQISPDFRYNPFVLNFRWSVSSAVVILGPVKARP